MADDLILYVSEDGEARVALRDAQTIEASYAVERHFAETVNKTKAFGGVVKWSARRGKGDA
jgi:hypothetical protein